ncbi:MAG: DNA polymerase III subunit gamma/tau [Alphaproteobacteria bacterium]|nr:DNA polymerase III subunit gamma/tau [Alphaproteobacteria bacterium]
MTEPATAYRVLARKYRPATFAELIGQEPMVRTLSNAIATGRIAHAFILTGVRGVGKTTTARIIARALNCVGADGTGGPTIQPCGECVHCRSIAEDRHVDVIEMDAASRTGVDDIRDLTEGVRYRPVSARYKVYIIDEVHMLSKSAFNALLKTLEEPPPDVKFVFATTEIQKVPATVLSRCQRFSLRRVPVEQLVPHYRRVAEAEGVAVEPAALALIARAADGSVRDGLSLLDQAIARSSLGHEVEPSRVDEGTVRDMLGIADRGRVFDLFEAVLKGDAAAALDGISGLYRDGADPLSVIQELLELSHFVTRLKLVQEAGSGDPLAEGDRERARPLAASLSIPVLARCWQMLLKGVEEVQSAPAPMQAAEMVLVRLAYVADLPPPAELVRTLAEHDAGNTGSAFPRALGATVVVPTAAPAPLSGERVGGRGRPAEMPQTPSPNSPFPGRATLSRETGEGFAVAAAAAPQVAAAELSRPQLQPASPGAAVYDPMPQSFAEVVALFERRREPLIHTHLVSHVHLVAFEPGHIEFRPGDDAPRDLANRLGQLLGEWTGARWVVAVSQAEGAPTLQQEARRRDGELRNEVAEHPLVRAVMDTFPGATIAAVRERIVPGPVSEADAEADAEDGTSSEEDGP